MSLEMTLWKESSVSVFHCLSLASLPMGVILGLRAADSLMIEPRARPAASSQIVLLLGSRCCRYKLKANNNSPIFGAYRSLLADHSRAEKRAATDALDEAKGKHPRHERSNLTAAGKAKAKAKSRTNKSK